METTEQQSLIASVAGVMRRSTARAMERPSIRWLRSVRRHILRRSEGERTLLDRFAGTQGYLLDPANPRTYTEKLYCRMVRWNRRIDPKYTRLADKLAVRPYVRERVGEHRLSKLLWQGTDPTLIPFDDLPDRYVIKANHGCGFVVLVAGTPPDRGAVIRKASGWLTTNLYWVAREYQYFHIPPRLFVEEYLANADGSEALVYRFWCFHGVPALVAVTNFAQTINPYYDLDWNQLDFTASGRILDRPRFPRPVNFDDMVDVAVRLSKDFDFVRVDLYSVDNQVRFGELTFTPGAGFTHINPKDWDLKLGRLWTLAD